MNYNAECLLIWLEATLIFHSRERALWCLLFSTALRYDADTFTTAYVFLSGHGEGIYVWWSRGAGKWKIIIMRQVAGIISTFLARWVSTREKHEAKANDKKKRRNEILCTWRIEVVLLHSEMSIWKRTNSCVIAIYIFTEKINELLNSQFCLTSNIPSDLIGWEHPRDVWQEK